MVKNKAMLMHHLVSGAFSMPVESDDKPVNKEKILQQRLDLLLERLISLRLSQTQMCRELGFDLTRETFVKCERSICIVLDLKAEYHLVIMMEMNPLKVEFFDCDQYVTTIDDLVSTLLEVLASATGEAE